MNSTPLPDLERELHAAARRLDRTAPRRAWWRHSWALLSIAVVGVGAGVAVARVAHVGPFAYLDRFGDYNPKLAATQMIEVEAPGAEPAWRAVAFLNKIGQFCITGGPRDPRTDPTTPRPEHRRSAPPSAGVNCAGNTEIAQLLVDPRRPGATFAGNTALNGSPDVHTFRAAGPGKPVERLSDDFPTRMLVYAAAPAGLTPVVRWGANGEPISMRPSGKRLRVRVDKSADGLSSREHEIVRSFPDEIDVVLWAAETPIPKGVSEAQVVMHGGVPPHGVDDRTIEVLSVDEIVRMDRAARARGWRYRRGISRDPAPVARESSAQRARVAAFARPRSGADAVPSAVRPAMYREFHRVQYGASRRLTISGGGVANAWVVPGGLLPESELPGRPGDLTCFVGAPILGDCKYGAGQWKRPVVEAVSCSRGFAPGESFVWALSPPGASRVELLRGRTVRQRLSAAELVALRRSRATQPTAIRWVMRQGPAITVRVPWATTGPARCGTKPPAWTSLRRDSVGGRRSSGGPSAPRR